MAKKSKSKKLQVVAGEFYTIKGQGVMKCTQSPNDNGIAFFNQSYSANVSEVTGKADYEQYKECRDESMEKCGHKVALSSHVRKFIAKQPENTCMADIVKHVLSNQKMLEEQQSLWLELFKLTDVVGLWYLAHDMVKNVDAKMESVS